MKISVITVVYNARETVADAIGSVLRQSHQDVELIVIDGASVDGTLEKLEPFKPRIDVFVSEPDEGIYDALNKGIAKATGDVVGFLHADDLYADRKVLEKIASAFEDETVDAVYGDLAYVSKTSPEKIMRYWKAGEFSFDKLRKGWMPPHPTLYVRRSVYERWGGFDTSFSIASDYDCILRLFSRDGFRSRYLPDLLVRMRVGGESNRSLRNILRKSLEDYRALKKNGVGGGYALLAKNVSKIPQFFVKI